MKDLMKAKDAMQIFSDFKDLGVNATRLIEKICLDYSRAATWMDAERKLRHMREVYEQISDISWEKKSDQLWELSNEAEEEVNVLVAAVNEYREFYGVEKAEEV
jgi:hypothetical protein